MPDGNGSAPAPIEVPPWLLNAFERRFGQLEMDIVKLLIEHQAMDAEIQRLNGLLGEREPVTT